MSANPAFETIAGMGIASPHDRGATLARSSLVATMDTIAASERDVFVHVADRLGVRAGLADRMLEARPTDSVASPRAPVSASRQTLGDGLPPGSEDMRRAFALLGLLPVANRGKIDAAYLDLVQRYEPTRVGQLGAELAALAVRRLAAITDAYDAAVATMP